MTRTFRYESACSRRPWVAIPPPTYGGTESVVDQLACELAAAGHQATLYVHHW